MGEAWITPRTDKGVGNSERFSNLLKTAQLSSGGIRREALQYNPQSPCSLQSGLGSKLSEGEGVVIAWYLKMDHCGWVLQ